MILSCFELPIYGEKFIGQGTSSLYHKFLVLKWQVEMAR